MKLSHLLTVATGASLLAFAAVAATASNMSTDFVKNASIGNEFEIESSQLALTKSQSQPVKDFAQQMIDDHGKAGQTLMATLPKSSVSPDVATKTLDSKHQHMLDKLNGLSGADFDKKYISEQTDAHKETISLFQKYAKKR